jgi:hypothetical protein
MSYTTSGQDYLFLWILTVRTRSLSEYSTMYTDGSNDSDMVASAAVFGQQIYSLRLPSASSIFVAEANAIRLVLKFAMSYTTSGQDYLFLWILTVRTRSLSNYAM